jgi:hypothetical protein
MPHNLTAAMDDDEAWGLGDGGDSEPDGDDPMELAGEDNNVALEYVEPGGSNFFVQQRGIKAVLANLPDCEFPIQPGDRVLNAFNISGDPSKKPVPVGGRDQLKSVLQEEDLVMLLLIDSFGITTRQLHALKLLQHFKWWKNYKIQDWRTYKRKEALLPKLRTFLRSHVCKDGSLYPIPYILNPIPYILDVILNPIPYTLYTIGSVRVSPHHSIFDVIRYRFLQVPGNFKRLVFHAQVAEACREFWHGGY